MFKKILSLILIFLILFNSLSNIYAVKNEEYGYNGYISMDSGCDIINWGLFSKTGVTKVYNQVWKFYIILADGNEELLLATVYGGMNEKINLYYIDNFKATKSIKMIYTCTTLGCNSKPKNREARCILNLTDGGYIYEHVHAHTYVRFSWDGGCKGADAKLTQFRY